MKAIRAVWMSRWAGVAVLGLWLLLLVAVADFVAANSPPPPESALLRRPSPELPTATPTIVTMPVIERDAAARFATLQVTMLPPTPTTEPTPESLVVDEATALPPLPTPIPRLPPPATATATVLPPTPTPPVGAVLPATEHKQG